MATSDRGELTGHFALVYPSKYIKAADLGGQDVTVTILRVRRETIEMEGGKKDQKAVFYLADSRGRPLEKTWVAGKTVLKQVGAALGTPTIGEWKGQRVTMYPTTCKGKGGETLECIRVRARVGRGTDIPESMAEPNGEQQGPPPDDRPSEPAAEKPYPRLWRQIQDAGPGQIDTLAAECKAAFELKAVTRGEAANLSKAIAERREALAGVVDPGAEPPAVQS